ncbi:hypothetical protein EJB05_09240 [Eragrostis curvula]|uniref:MSP domain-containing protein n=1 Tax=Eragrostis curvula TaxID=38414 RepID=A0A5J9W4E8_9POAL|nr:hypothetical protein EJB05_09240 [Eragrostis curvula]
MHLRNKTTIMVSIQWSRTTNPKQYCVRPNIGVVLPGSTCDVYSTNAPQRTRLLICMQGQVPSSKCWQPRMVQQLKISMQQCSIRSQGRL